LLPAVFPNHDIRFGNHGIYNIFQNNELGILKGQWFGNRQMMIVVFVVRLEPNMLIDIGLIYDKLSMYRKVMKVT
jgi:hypothetical protein